MSTMEQKIKKIEDVILQRANAQADDIIFKAMTQKNELLEKSEIEILQRKYKEINYEILEIQKKTTQYIAKFEEKCKKNLLLQREDYFNSILKNVFFRLSDFVKTNEYKNFYINRFKKINLDNNMHDMIFFIKPSDLILHNLIIDYFGEISKIRQDIKIKLGGVVILNNKTGLCLDESLDTRLEKQKEWFRSHAELLSY